MHSEEHKQRTNDPVSQPECDAEILSISAEFSAEISIGGRPDLNAWLARVSPDRQASLLKRLESVANAFDLPVEDRSEQSTSGQATVVQSQSQELVDSASMTQTGQGTAAFAAEQAPVKELGDYDLLGELGRGGMGVVYRARHRERGDVVALKILPHVDGESLHRFKREFRSLADISHPNLIGLRSLENEGQQWFFTMDLVENARSFRRFVRPNNELNLGRLKSSMLQLCEGLRKLHELDIIHRDLKPSNVVVDENGRVVILDFGLVTELNRNEQTKSIASVSGTPAYMSPEAAGGEGESFASDWYSVGVMLYQALSGKLPFEGDTLQILADKRAKDAPELDRPADVPAELTSLCMALLSRNPEERPGLVDIQAACGAQTTANASQTSAERNILLGRDWHLAQLRSCFQSVSHTGKPSIVFVSGKSGEGKSALIEAFLAELRSTQEIAILSGRCYDRESVPFKALDSLIDALVSYLRKMDGSEVAYLLPDDTGYLARVFPVLMRVEAVAKRPQPDLAGFDEQQIRKRSFHALKELLRRLSQQIRIVLVCDDLQWGDTDSAQVLVDIFSGAAIPELMLIGSFRSDEAEASPFLTAWKEEFQGRDDQATPIDVAPLQRSDCQVLLEHRFPQLAGRRANEFAQELYDETGGNPFFVNEVLDCLQFDGREIRRIPMARVLGEKLSRLPAEASEIMNAVAVSGQSLEIPELLASIGESKTAYSTLNAMRNLSLLRFLDEDSGGRIDTYHDKIRETVLEALGASGRRKYHQRLAVEIERRSPELDSAIIDQILAGEDIEHPDVARIYDLAFHFNASGEAEKAGLYAFLAAEQARRQFSPAVAASNYSAARLSIQEGPLRALEARYVEGAAESFHRLGKYEEAQQVLDSLRGQPSNALQQARIAHVACQVLWWRNEFHEALEQARSGLRLLGVRVPRSSIGLWSSLCALLVRHVLRRGTWRPGNREPKNSDLLTLRFIDQASCVTSFIDGVWMLWFILVGLRKTREFRPTSETSRIYAIFSAIASLSGFQSHADKYAHLSREIADQRDDTYSRGLTQLWSGLSDFASASYDQAAMNLSHGCGNFSRVGGQFFLNISKFHLGLAHTCQGRFELGMRQLKETFDSSVQVQDMRTNCALYGMTRSSDGWFDLDRYVQDAVINEEDVLSTCNLDKARGIRSLHLGEYKQAIHFFERAFFRPLKSFVPNWHVAAGLPFLACAHRMLAQECEEANPKEARAHLKRSLKVARRGVWICWFFPTENSFALREYGAALARVGKYKKAERYLNKSCQVSHKYDTPYELAKSKLALADLAVLQGRPDASVQLETAQAELAVFRQQITDALSAIEPRI